MTTPAEILRQRLLNRAQAEMPPLMASIPPAPVQQFMTPAVPPPSRLEQRMAIAAGPDSHQHQYAEIYRITCLPLIREMTKEEVDAYTAQNTLAQAYAEGFRFGQKQAECIYAYEMTGGLLANIGVGFGKTLVSLMVAQKAFMKGLRKIVLHVPSQVFAQLVTVDIKWARARVPLSYPIMPLGGKPMAARRQICMSGKVGLYILPYSLMSAKDAEENLWAISPDLIIADECQNLANEEAAKTARFHRYMAAKAKEGKRVEFAGMSGTITDKSINDYASLARYAMGTNCPLPMADTMLQAWAAVLDTDQDDSYVSADMGGPLLPLVKWAKQTFPTVKIQEDRSGFRAAFRLRLTTAPGMISSGDQTIGTSLLFNNSPVKVDDNDPGMKKLLELLLKVDVQWQTPNDDNIDYAIHKWKWMYELSAGFYNQLTWADPLEYAVRKNIRPEDAYKMLEAAKVHHAANQEYLSLLRDFIQNLAKPGLDTPFLIAGDMYRNKNANVPQELYEAWAYKEALDFAGRPERDEKCVRVCDYKIRDAVEWAKTVPQGQGALIWYYHQEIGRWLYQELHKAGADVLHCPAGPQHNVTIIKPENKHKIVVATWEAHGTGKNLQHFQHQMVVQWPRGASDAEQLIGRTHRQGQKADSLTVRMNNTTEFDDLNFAACLNDALYIQQSTGVKQKVIYGAYDPVPKIFPSSVLRERGFDIKHKLTQEQQKQMAERFGAA